MSIARTALILGALVSFPAGATPINVTFESSTRLVSDHRMSALVSVRSYARTSPDAPWPTQVGLELLFGDVSELELQPVPGTTGEYYPEYRFDAWLESLDRRYRVSFFDGDAWRLGFDDGVLVLKPGTIFTSQGERQIGLLSGTASFSVEQSEALFGPDWIARIVLRNLGPNIEAGLGDSGTMRTSLRMPGVSGLGDSQVSGQVLSVQLDNPEPGTLALLGLGLTGLAVVGRRRARRRSSIPPRWF